MVTPLAGVRIEIGSGRCRSRRKPVTPLAGVRIEISSLAWVRGPGIVTPLAGVRIEMVFVLYVILDLRKSPPSRG